MSARIHLATRATPRGGMAAFLARLLAVVFPAEGNRPVLVAIGGPGGAGKSTLAAALARELGAPVLALDHYKTPRADRAAQGLFGAHPDANRIDLTREHLAMLRAGRPIHHPVYDIATGEANSSALLEPGRFVVVDGEISTYDCLRDLMDFAIFLDSDWKTQLSTRVTRDVEQRGYSREKAIATFLESNLREFQQHGAASKQFADLHLYAHHDHRIDIESVEQSLYDRVRDLLAPLAQAMVLDGLIVPLMVPFTDDGSIDEASLIRHLEFLAEAGVRRLLTNGTTGEFFSLTMAERHRVLAVARRFFPGVLLHHVGHPALADALADMARATDEGADAIISLPPFYFAGAPVAGLVRWFTALANAAMVPLLIYNFPAHTGNPVTAELLAAVPHHGMKDSSGDMAMIAATPRYYVGGDRVLFDAWRAGGAGFVSARANAEPGPYVEMDRLQRAGDAEAAGALQRGAIAALVEALPGTRQILRLKQHLAAGHLPGYPTNVRPPLG